MRRSIILNEEYQEQIEDDPDEIAIYRERAVELLAWRGARIAIHIFSNIDPPQYLGPARGEDLALLHCGASLHSRFRHLVAADSTDQLTVPCTLPGDKGWAGIPGLLKLQQVSPKAGWITLWGEWTDLLGEPPGRVVWSTAVSSALSEGREEALRQTAETAADISSSDRALKSLQRILGVRLDALSHVSYATLLATEQIRLLEDFADPGVAMVCFGRAVEFQLRHQTEKRCSKSLRKRLYPNRDSTNLGGFLANLRSLSRSEAADFNNQWSVPADALDALSRFIDTRNRAAHGEPQGKHSADRAVGDWLDCMKPDAQRLWSILTPDWSA